MNQKAQEVHDKIREIQPEKKPMRFERRLKYVKDIEKFYASDSQYSEEEQYGPIKEQIRKEGWEDEMDEWIREFPDQVPPMVKKVIQNYFGDFTLYPEQKRYLKEWQNELKKDPKASPLTLELVRTQLESKAVPFYEMDDDAKRHQENNFRFDQLVLERYIQRLAAINEEEPDVDVENNPMGWTDPKMIHDMLFRYADAQVKPPMWDVAVRLLYEMNLKPPAAFSKLRPIGWDEKQEEEWEDAINPRENEATPVQFTFAEQQEIEVLTGRKIEEIQDEKRQVTDIGGGELIRQVRMMRRTPDEIPKKPRKKLLNFFESIKDLQITDVQFSGPTPDLELIQNRETVNLHTLEAAKWLIAENPMLGSWIRTDYPDVSFKNCKYLPEEPAYVSLLKDSKNSFFGAVLSTFKSGLSVAVACAGIVAAGSFAYLYGIEPFLERDNVEFTREEYYLDGNLDEKANLEAYLLDQHRLEPFDYTSNDTFDLVPTQHQIAEMRHQDNIHMEYEQERDDLFVPDLQDEQDEFNQELFNYDQEVMHRGGHWNQETRNY